MNINMQATVRRLSNATITRIRTDGSYVNSVWTPGTPASVDLKCVCVPVSGKTRDALPEGVRDRGAYEITLVGADTIRIDKAGTGELTDVIVYRGIRYEAMNPWDYADHGYYNRTVLLHIGDATL